VPASREHTCGKPLDVRHSPRRWGSPAIAVSANVRSANSPTMANLLCAAPSDHVRAASDVEPGDGSHGHKYYGLPKYFGGVRAIPPRDPATQANAVRRAVEKQVARRCELQPGMCCGSLDAFAEGLAQESVTGNSVAPARNCSRIRLVVPVARYHDRNLSNPSRVMRRINGAPRQCAVPRLREGPPRSRVRARRVASSEMVRLTA
jgi:hypothetical protein